MKQQWQKLAVRIDAMQLRERVFLFLAIIICCVALADAVWLSPAQLAHKQITLRQAAQGAELQRLRDELKTLAQPVDASKTVRDDIAATNRMVDAD
jgi:MSHA biogenesis protein MshJ